MPAMLIVLGIVVFFAAIVGGTTGLGFSMISAIAMSLLISPKDAVVLLSVMVPPLTLTQVIYHRAHAGRDVRLRWLLVPAILGVLVGVALFSVLPERAIGGLLGALILVFVTLRLLDVKIRISPDHQRIAGPIAGLAGGILSGSSGVSGPIFASYLLSLGTPPRTFAFTLSAVYVVLTTVRFAGLVVAGSMTWMLVASGALLLVPALFGQWIGFGIQRSQSARRIEQVILVVLLMTALRVLSVSIFG